ncbi:MAG TPA: response regulator transcription factor [Vicinamibacterales bacterium]|nr:response regulator transcription factor [Vicinamibacterales bacterium]
MSRPRVLLADDHAMLLEAFHKLLADEYDVVGTVTDGRALVASAKALKPDIAVVDVSMPLLNGMDAARQIKEVAPETRVVFLTMNEDVQLASEAVKMGAAGYVLKRAAASDLLTALREVTQGNTYVTPFLSDGMGMMSPAIEEDSAAKLTARQREIVQLVAEGHSMREVAAILKIAARTVAFHKYRAMEQLNISTTAELIQFAIKHHIVG